MIDARWNVFRASRPTVSSSLPAGTGLPPFGRATNFCGSLGAARPNAGSCRPAIERSPDRHPVAGQRLSTVYFGREYVPTRRFIAITLGSIAANNSRIVSPGLSLRSAFSASTQK